MIRIFNCDEIEYNTWLKCNESGFIFNNFGGRAPSYNIIHKASCWTLRRKKDEDSRTKIEKVCSEDLTELVNEATKIRESESGWSKCKFCFPTL